MGVFIITPDGMKKEFNHREEVHIRKKVLLISARMVLVTQAPPLTPSCYWIKT